MADVWTLAETDGRVLRDSSKEIIAEGRALADSLRGRLHVFLLGAALEQAVQSIASLDVDEIVRIEHPLLEPYDGDRWTTSVAGYFHDGLHGPLLVSATVIGQEIAPRIAARLNTEFIGDSIWLKIGPLGDVRVIQPVGQDRFHATLSCKPEAPLVVTIRPGVVGFDTPARSRTPQVTRYIPDLADNPSRVQVEKVIPGDPATIRLPEADRIVAGGGGVHDEPGWQSIRELAGLLDAAVGGSRLALDHHFVPQERMIGQTGQTVHPQLYIAVGISGASHHLLGVTADTFLAINHDRGAPIHKKTTLSVIGDLYEILPRLVERMKTANAEEPNL